MPGHQTAFQHLLTLKNKSGLKDAELRIWAARVPLGGGTEEDVHFLSPYLDKVIQTTYKGGRLGGTNKGIRVKCLHID